MKIQKVFPLLVITINYQCKYLCAFPNLWDVKSQGLLKDSLHFKRWQQCSCFIFMYFCFLVRELYQYLGRAKSSAIYSEMAYHLLYILSFFLSLCDKLNCYRIRQTYSETFNGFVKYFIDFTDTFMSNQTKQERKFIRKREILLQIVIQLFMANNVIIPILAMVHYCRKPVSSVYCTSAIVVDYLEGHTFLKALYFIVIGLLHLFMVANIIAELSINTICSAIPVHYYAAVFHDFRSKYRPNFAVDDDEADIPESKKAEAEKPIAHSQTRILHLVHFYRTAQIVQIHFCQLFHGRFLPANFTMTYFVVVGMLCLIRFNESLSWEIKGIIGLAVFFGYFGWAMALWFLGQYFVTSKAFLNSWQHFNFGNAQDKKVMKRFLRSCKPTEMITEPKLIRFRLMNVLKYMHFVIWRLCKTLVATQKMTNI